jgi:hypothetical protein
MEREKFKEQILKAIFRKIGHETNKSASLMEVETMFDHTDRESFYNAVIELVNDHLLFDRARGHVAFTPDGWDKANNLVNSPPIVNKNTLNINNAHNSPIQQGIHSEQTQTTSYVPSKEDLQRLIDLMNTHFGELKLSLDDERKAKAQLATIEAQLIDEPNPTIIKEAGRSLKNITEGAIGSILATAAQPGIWKTIQSLLALL